MARRPKSGFDVQIVPTTEWPRVARGLIISSQRFGDDIEDVVREHAEKLANNTRRGVMSIPTTGRHSNGVRATIAANVDVEVERDSSGKGVIRRARIVVKNLPDEIRKLPRLFDQRSFRHPVFGNENVWVTQTSRPWFRSRILRGRKPLQNDIESTMNNYTRAIGRLG